MRKYIGFWDDGHDRGEIEFYSDHRANSKANLEDARREYRLKHGYARSRQIEIKETVLY